ncbi:MAG: UDP-N-acetylmuramate dehydrogenase [Alphaproteobacteria bacterium]|nr:UDP-N-acetylmuramate dehydrogenase [Alphaproteobacteria bacterium]
MCNKNIMEIFANVKGKYLLGERLSKHTRFGVGGPAEVMFFPHDLEDLVSFLKHYPQHMPLCVLGGGSNLLVRDGGIDGVVLKLSAPFFKKIEKKENRLTCFAGVANATLSKTLIENQIGGLEFLCSIPGTIGGALRTNAGCFENSVSDVFQSALVVDRSGTVFEAKKEAFGLSYRHSDFPKDWIIVALTFKTEAKPAEQIRQTLEQQKQYRLLHQPCDARTAGSTFKNPKDARAWELIKQAGCENLSCGGAKVSEKHCNFLINTGNASAADLENLGDLIVQKVKEKTGTLLEWEVQKTGKKA